MDQLSTTREVMEALGGTSAVAKLTGRTYAAAFNWLDFKTFPSNTYVAMTEALAAKGKTASASLWGMVEPPRSERESAA
ncbi:MAG: hypothetical protein AB7R40_23855 [Nitrospiraceae bacterium]